MIRDNPLCYLRYHSSLRPKTDPVITMRVLDVELLRPNHAIVAVSSPVKGRRCMFMHLDRKTGSVSYFRPTAPALNTTSEYRVHVGTEGEFLTP